MDRLSEGVPVWRPRPLTKFKPRPGAVPVAEWHRLQQQREREDILKKSMAVFVLFPMGWLLLSLWLLAGQ
jgi:hypothetical protein